MKKVVRTFKSLWKDESAQGATEYILLLVVVVGIAMIFGPKIKEVVKAKGEDLQKAISGFTPES